MATTFNIGACECCGGTPACCASGSAAYTLTISGLGTGSGTATWNGTISNWEAFGTLSGGQTYHLRISCISGTWTYSVEVPYPGGSVETSSCTYHAGTNTFTSDDGQLTFSNPC